MEEQFTKNNFCVFPSFSPHFISSCSKEMNLMDYPRIIGEREVCLHAPPSPSSCPVMILYFRFCLGLSNWNHEAFQSTLTSVLSKLENNLRVKYSKIFRIPLIFISDNLSITRDRFHKTHAVLHFSESHYRGNKTTLK